MTLGYFQSTFLRMPQQGLELLEVGTSTVDTSDSPRTCERDNSILPREGGNRPTSEIDASRIAGSSGDESDMDLRTDYSSVCTDEDWGFSLYDLWTPCTTEEISQVDTVEFGRLAPQDHLGEARGGEPLPGHSPRSLSWRTDSSSDIMRISNIYRTIRTELAWTSWAVSLYWKRHMDIQGEWLVSIAVRGGPVAVSSSDDIIAVRSLQIPLAHARLGSMYLYLSLVLALLRCQHGDAERRFHRSLR